MNARIDLHTTTRDVAQRMLDALRNPACYPHPVQHVEILETRVTARAAHGSDASEATLAVLERQIAAHEPLSADELRHTMTINAAVDPAVAGRVLSGRLIQRLRQ